MSPFLFVSCFAFCLMCRGSGDMSSDIPDGHGQESTATATDKILELVSLSNSRVAL